jgi:hypothetical protein
MVILFALYDNGNQVKRYPLGVYENEKLALESLKIIDSEYSYKCAEYKINTPFEDVPIFNNDEIKQFETAFSDI